MNTIVIDATATFHLPPALFWMMFSMTMSLISVAMGMIQVTDALRRMAAKKQPRKCELEDNAEE